MIEMVMLKFAEFQKICGWARKAGMPKELLEKASISTSMLSTKSKKAKMLNKIRRV
jgi:hypothetical protein